MVSIPTLIRGSANQYFDLFERAADNVAQAGVLLDEMLRSFPETRELAQQIHALENDGDQITHELIRLLNETFVTPIDSRDVLALASALDDIVDEIDEVADLLVLYRIEAPMLQAQAQAGVLRDATRRVAEIVPRIRGFRDVAAGMAAVQQLENEGDRLTREAIASLFESGIDPMVVIRWKDIFEGLETAIDATEQAAYIIHNIVTKNR